MNHNCFCCLFYSFLYLNFMPFLERYFIRDKGISNILTYNLYKLFLTVCYLNIL